jgi:acetyl/propionyl-CoA carboxylase alpha subunit
MMKVTAGGGGKGMRHLKEEDLHAHWKVLVKKQPLLLGTTECTWRNCDS